MDDRGRYNIRSGSFLGMPASDATTIRPDVVEPASPEDGTSFKRSAQIDMRDLMGDAVGNVRIKRFAPSTMLTRFVQMSISPDSESLVLAAYVGTSMVVVLVDQYIRRLQPSRLIHHGAR